MIVAVGGAPVQNVHDLQRLMVADLIGVPTSVKIVRAGRVEDVELIPEELTV